MPRIASVVFRGGGKVYQFDAGSLEVAPGDRVVVDTSQGADFGRLVKGPDEVPPETRDAAPPVTEETPPPPPQSAPRAAAPRRPLSAALTRTLRSGI